MNDDKSVYQNHSIILTNTMIYLHSFSIIFILNHAFFCHALSSYWAIEPKKWRNEYGYKQECKQNISYFGDFFLCKIELWKFSIYYICNNTSIRCRMWHKIYLTLSNFRLPMAFWCGSCCLDVSFYVVFFALLFGWFFIF